MVSRKEFLNFVVQQHGYSVEDWQPIKSRIPPLGARIFTIGKDDEGYFTHINNEFLLGDEDILTTLGATHWQLAK